MVKINCPNCGAGYYDLDPDGVWVKSVIWVCKKCGTRFTQEKGEDYDK